eukprot:m.172201 g.172201  ORF g.172201 m.172201 type:complete len:408 (-) comp15363_c0_seq6:88-1311(-)
MTDYGSPASVYGLPKPTLKPSNDVDHGLTNSLPPDSTFLNVAVSDEDRGKSLPANATLSDTGNYGHVKKRVLPKIDLNNGPSTLTVEDGCITPVTPAMSMYGIPTTPLSPYGTVTSSTAEPFFASATPKSISDYYETAENVRRKSARDIYEPVPSNSVIQAMPVDRVTSSIVAVDGVEEVLYNDETMQNHDQHRIITNPHWLAVDVSSCAQAEECLHTAGDDNVQVGTYLVWKLAEFRYCLSLMGFADRVYHHLIFCQYGKISVNGEKVKSCKTMDELLSFLHKEHETIDWPIPLVGRLTTIYEDQNNTKITLKPSTRTSEPRYSDALAGLRAWRSSIDYGKDTALQDEDDDNDNSGYVSPQPSSQPSITSDNVRHSVIQRVGDVRKSSTLKPTRETPYEIVNEAFL